MSDTTESSTTLLNECTNYGCFDLEEHMIPLLTVFGCLVFAAYMIERGIAKAEKRAEVSSAPLLGSQMLHNICRELMVLGMISFILQMIIINSKNISNANHDMLYTFEMIHLALFCCTLLHVCFVMWSSSLVAHVETLWELWDFRCERGLSLSLSIYLSLSLSLSLF